MFNLFLKRIICMLVIVCLVTPFYPTFVDASGENVDVSIDFIGSSCSQPYEDLPVVIKADVLNLGNSSIENITVRIYLDNVSNVLLSDTISSIQANESYRLSLDWNATVGNHSFFAEVDYLDSINESNESNNDDVFNISVSSRDSLPLTDTISTWREGESWNNSYDTSAYDEWDNTVQLSSASNGIFTRQNTVTYDGDYAEWNFTVYESNTYYIWIRGYFQDTLINTNDSCHDVRLYWINESTYQIGVSENWWTNYNDWKWTNFSDNDGIYLSEGNGTLQIKGFERHLIKVDNILITQFSPAQFTPSGKGIEGCDNYTIGNSPPTANDDDATTDEDCNVWIDVLNNDSDVESSLDPSSVTVTSGPSMGTTSVNTSTGFIEYDPDDDKTGSDYFYYTVDDDQGATSDEAKVDININSVNDPPELYNYSFSPSEGSCNTNFSFDIWYRDVDGDQPTEKKVIISGTDYTMSKVSGNPAIPFIAHYRLNTTLLEGTHNHFYNFSDGEDYTRFPVKPGLIYGPEVYGLPTISIESYTIDDDYNGDSFGNNNSTMEGGEIIELMVTLKNNGTAVANNVSATLSTNDPNISTLNNPMSFGDISVNGSASEEFLVEVDINHMGQNNVLFSLNIQDDNGSNWTDSLSINIYKCPGLNYQYVKDITQSLSDIIFESYTDGEIAKGRAFGSKGEIDAMRDIEGWMKDIDIFDVVVNDSLDGKEAKDVQILDYGFRVNNGSGYYPVECYIGTIWNKTLHSLLSFNCSYLGQNLEIDERPSFGSYENFITNSSEDLLIAMENGTITDYDSYYNYSIHLYETHYNFSFESIDLGNCSTWPSYMRDYEINFGNNFVYIDEDPFFNPNPNFFTPLKNTIFNLFSNMSEYDDFVFFAAKLRLQLQIRIWSIFKKDCKGLILYDFNDHAYDMIRTKGFALPIIFINGTIGREINNSMNTHSVQFFINQSWNPNMESYNVVGQINGTNSDQTIIIGCLYDSWWCQGTADSAIGMGLLLGLADYYDRNDITPKCNVQFVAFSGEEAGYMGAMDYAKKIKWNNEPTSIDINQLTYMIDLNQLGFTDPWGERLTMHIMTNNISVRNNVDPIALRTDYKNRTKDLANYSTIYVNNGGPSNCNPFSREIKDCKTLLFLKNSGWTMHHRDGRENGTGLSHTEGDVFKYYHNLDVHITGEMLLNVSHYYTNGPTPVTSLSTNSLDFGELEAGTNHEKGFTISNSGDGTLYYNFVENYDWLSISPVSGDVTGEIDSISVFVNTSNLSGGSYLGKITVSSTGGDQIINVIFSVPYSKISIPLNNYWNFISMPVNQTVEFNNVTFKFNNQFYNWTNASSSGLINPYVFGWNRTSNQYTFSNAFDPGFGYWLFTYNDITLLIDDVNVDIDNYITTIYPGWNIFGIPFNQSTDKVNLLVNSQSWEDAVSDEWVLDFIYDWDSAIQMYGFTSTFDPGFGYWIHATNKTESYILSKSGSPTFNDFGNDAVWQLNLTAVSNDNNISGAEIIIGEHLNATDGQMNDIFDAPSAPTPPANSYIILYSDDNLSAPFQTLSRDFRYWPDAEKTWNLSISFISNNLSNTTINLSWNISSLAEIEYESILLYDNTTNLTVDMLTQNYSQFIMTVNTSRGLQIICSNGTLPLFENVTVSPDGGGFGEEITLSADVTNLADNINVVKVNVTYPDDSTNNFTMTNTENDTYQYEFNDTWLTGTYDFMIWATDIHGNTNHSSLYEFEIVANASIQVCTVKNTYMGEDYINVTDPPASPTFYDIGYELLDDQEVLHIWNKYDSYYFDTDSGIQLTNHYGEYWSHNVLMLGYYNNDEWNLIYRTDELSGFQKSIDTDNQTYVNATLWKDLTYYGYEFRLALRYHLELTDNELTVIPYIKNLGDPIPYTLGFAWEINDIKIDDTLEEDYILINDSYYWLNESLDLSFTNLSKPVYCWNETLNESIVCGYEPIPYFHIQENLTNNRVRSLYLRWNPDVNYKVWIQSRNDSYNAPIMLGIQIGTLDAGESKQTSLYWYDADQQVFYYDTNSPFETWTSNPGYMVDNNTATFASTSTLNDVQKLTGNTCPEIDPGSISKVEMRAFGKRDQCSCSVLLRPVFRDGDGDDHEFMLPLSASWSEWFDITDDSNVPSWTWEDVSTFDCDVESSNFSEIRATVYCAKVEVRVTYSPWTPPSITNPTPGFGSTNVSIQPRLGITVSDDNGDELDISWLSNSSGSWQEFATNNSVGNGTYYQTFEGATVNGQWWYWMLNVSDDHNYNESSVFKFYTGTQSKLVNTGETAFRGYLLMQAEYWNGTSWITDQIVIDDVSPRVLNASGVLGLDTVFNGLLDTGELHYGDGSYRMYAAFCDPDGEVLVANDSKLESWWTFELDLI